MEDFDGYRRYALSAVVAGGHTSLSETKLHMGGVQTEKLRMRAQETIKCTDTILGFS